MIAALILFSTWILLRGSLDLALDKVPGNVDAGRMLAYPTAPPSRPPDLPAFRTISASTGAHLVAPVPV
jgi:hypothetical protein